MWLHLGALGPKRVQVHDDASLPPPPYAVVDNPLTWLDHFDLVFIDPPHTGWSVSASEEARKQHLSVDGDVEALALRMKFRLLQQSARVAMSQRQQQIPLRSRTCPDGLFLKLLVPKPQ